MEGGKIKTVIASRVGWDLFGKGHKEMFQSDEHILYLNAGLGCTFAKTQ